MPGQTIHIEISARLEWTDDIADRADLILGSIAPDAIHERRDWSRRQKRYTHLVRKGETLEQRFIRLGDLWERHKDGAQAAFTWGWISHLMADNLWSHLIGRGFWQFHMPDSPHADRTAAWYEESSIAEKAIAAISEVRDGALRLLRDVIPEGFGGYVTDAELSAWRDRVLVWQDFDPRKDTRAATVFLPNRVQAFVEIVIETMGRCSSDGFENTFRWIERRYPEDYLMAID